MLRLVAAVFVLYGHAYPLTGHVPPHIFGAGPETLGVRAFFAISGFLIATSWLRDPHPIRFALKRVRRIMPALALVVLTCALVAGPLLSPLPFAAYYGHEQTLTYLGNIGFRLSYVLPAVFAENTYPHAVNGSLWSLPVEAALYVILPFLLLLPLRMVLVAVACVATIAGYLWRISAVPSPIVIYGSDILASLLVIPFFLAGAFISVARLERYLDWRLGLATLALLGNFTASTLPSEAVTVPLFTYAVLSIGMSSWPCVSQIGRIGDLSYGVYLWGFPVQQTVSAIQGRHGNALDNFVFALPITLLLGFLSWHLLEKHCLRRAPNERHQAVKKQTAVLGSQT